jgi:hypothetical protein
MKKKQTMVYKTLNRALSLMRPHNSATTIGFTEWLFMHLPERLRDAAWQDVAGNLHVDNRRHSDHKTLFVAHVDTVHRKAGANKIRKTTSAWYADGAALGADDGVGCALLMHMLHADVPAYYVFTQGEECGGIGAKHLAKEYPQLLAEFDRAIAFDRKGTDSIISHQGYGRCCSDAFADALSAELNATDEELMYSPDNTGVYTDTAEFVDIIPECTNVSCGYMYEHSDKEQLDMIHFDRLAEAVLVIDWDALVTDRDPTIPDPDDYYVGNNWWYNYKADPSVGGNKWDTSKWGSPADLDLDAAIMPWGRDDVGLLDADEYLYACLLDARQGFTRSLIELMSESVYPEDPHAAQKFINRNKLTEDVITMAMGMVGYNNTNDILCTLFDMAYVD